MQTFTAIVPTQPQLPPDLAILLAPVRSDEPSAPDAHVARADGVLLDEEGRVVAFILRLAKTLDPHGGRTLVPATALRLTEGPKLHLAWTEDQLRAQPRLDGDLQPHNHVDGGPPVESQWMPARPAVIPPGSGGNGVAAATEGVEGGLIGAAIGALAGLAIGGPIGAASLAVFFAAGGSLAGILSGASQDTAPEASEMHFAHLPAGDDGALGVALGKLEAWLREPRLVGQGFVSAMRLMPMTTTEAPLEAPPERAREVAGWR
jgi:hypothetical protein